MTLLGLYDLAEENGIEVDSFPMKETVAVSFPQGWIAINTDKIDNSIEEKVCLAHEIGHCATGSFYNTYSKFDIKVRQENRANKWAIKKLVPKDELETAVEHGITEPWELADYFDVTEDFMQKAIFYYQNGYIA